MLESLVAFALVCIGVGIGYFFAQLTAARPIATLAVEVRVTNGQQPAVVLPGAMIFEGQERRRGVD